MILFLLVIALVILSFIANYFHKYSLIFIIISAIIVLSCYFFIARYIHTPDSFLPAKQIQIYPLLGNYYNLLTESFKQGNMYIVDDTELQFLKDPNIYKTFPYYVNKNSNLIILQDLSYYNNKLYIYFGLTPLLLFYLPFNFVTNLFLSDNIVVLISSSYIFIISLFIIKNISKKITKTKIPIFIKFLTIILVGFCNYSLFLLIRPHTYEVAISLAGSLLLSSIFLFNKYNSKKQTPLLFLIGLLLSLSVGCRPQYILFIPLFIAAIIYIDSHNKINTKNIVLNNFIFLIPCLCYGVILGIYNILRFNSFFEFGFRYQLNSSKLSTWSFNFQDLFIGLKYYLFQYPILSSNFPIFSLAIPTGHSTGNELIVGIFYIFPMLLLLFFLPQIINYCLKIKNKNTFVFFVISIIIILCNLFISSVFGMTQRYVFEIVYLGIIVAILSFYYIYDKLSNNFYKNIANLTFILLFVFSIYINFSLLFCNNNATFYVFSNNAEIYKKVLSFLS
ncbi:MAG: hypothetical protein WCS83_06545 [Endomicrobiia bacterium]